MYLSARLQSNVVLTEGIKKALSKFEVLEENFGVPLLENYGPSCVAVELLVNL